MSSQRSSSPRSPIKRLTRALWGLAFVMAVLLAGRHYLGTDDGQSLPKLLDAPAFSLTHYDGSTVGLDDLAGKPWVADFVFTRCPGICPIMTQRMKELVADIPEGKARYVSISVDPEHDTPEVLKAYAEKNGAGPDWYFLTGAKDVIFSLVREGFLLAIDEAEMPPTGVGPAEPIVHSNRFVLVDADGKIRAYYNSFDNTELEKLRADLLRLAG